MLSQNVAGLAPETLYFYYVEAENSEEYDSGCTGSFVTLAEKVPPVPHPAVWLSEPDQINTSSIFMTADIARDISGPEEYIFDFALITMGDGNIDTDPRVQDPAGADEVADTLDDNLCLRAGSPCIDAGDNAAVPADIDDLDLDEDLLEHIPLDLAGLIRFADDPDTADTGIADDLAYPEIVDFGAYEYTR